MTKVIDIINQKKAPFASFELVPPLKGSDINKLYGAIEPLMEFCLLYTSPSPRDVEESRMPSSA